MLLLDLDKITAGLSKTWSGFPRDWDRSLRSGNYLETTRYNYLLAAAQLGRYLGECSPYPEVPHPDTGGRTPSTSTHRGGTSLPRGLSCISPARWRRTGVAVPLAAFSVL